MFLEKALKGFKTKYYYELKELEALVSINTSNIISYLSNIEEDNFKINLNIIDTK